ncbi:asparagine synthetase [Chlamydoabsidia padenii]|nr:asparagine synthetase [Chlamydoabsidia padenii]
MVLPKNGPDGLITNLTMCGFTVYLHGSSVSRNGDGQFPELALDESLDLINHRGPDGRGVYVSPNGRCGLGHARLSIIDVAGGQQPLSSQCKKIHAVVNGELYDHDRLICELKEKGHTFKTQCDSEMALHYYEDYDTDFVEHLRGEFAVAIWDERKGRLMIVRDRFGIKPVYYTTINGTFMAASEIKAFLALGWKPEWDVDSIVHHGAVTGNRTCFKDVYMLPPAHYLTVSSSGSICVTPYWDIEYPNKNVQDTRSVDEMIQGVREHLIEAIRLRLRADVPLGLFLSGGLDSATMLGVVTQLLREKDPKAKVNAFGVSFVGGGLYDEGDIAERTAAFCGANFERINLSTQDMIDHFEDTVWHCEQPLILISSIANYILAKRCQASGIKVILTGQGSDENFMGYEYLHHAYLLEQDMSTPGGFGRATEEKRHELLKLKTKQRVVMGLRFDENYKSPSAHRLCNIVMQDGYQGMLGCPSELYLDHVIEAHGEPDIGSAMLDSISGTVRSKARKNWHPSHTSMYLGNRLILPNLLLNQYGDRVEMAHSLEGRPPYLDHVLCEYVSTLPPSVKIRGDGETLNEKWILKEAMKPYVTDEIYKRTKHPFIPPPATLTEDKTTPYKPLIDKYLTKEKVDRLGWARWSHVEKQRDLFLENADGHASKTIMAMLSYVIIGEKFGVTTTTF